MTDRAPAEERGKGILYASGSYVLWGIVPLFFLLLLPLQADEIVGWRVVFSLVFCAILVAVTRGWSSIAAVIRQPRLLLLCGLAAGIIYLNWYLFTLAATTGNVLESSLGYFITPIISVVLGIVFFHERLRALQWAAFALSLLAVIVLSVIYGTVPWMALLMAVTFGLYGFVKKKIGARVDAISGLTLETLWRLPIAVIQLVVIAVTRGLEWGSLGAFNTTMVPLSGLVTVLPLLLFAAGTRRVPLIYIGILQFIEPLIQFVAGAVILGEPMPPARLLGFGIVWAAVALLVVDSLITLGARRRERRLARGIPTTATGPMQRIETAATPVIDSRRRP